jgi:hypothetical protein
MGATTRRLRRAHAQKHAIAGPLTDKGLQLLTVLIAPAIEAGIPLPELITPSRRAYLRRILDDTGIPLRINEAVVLLGAGHFILRSMQASIDAGTFGEDLSEGVDRYGDKLQIDRSELASDPLWKTHVAR